MLSLQENIQRSKVAWTHTDSRQNVNPPYRRWIFFKPCWMYHESKMCSPTHIDAPSNYSFNTNIYSIYSTRYTTQSFEGISALNKGIGKRSDILHKNEQAERNASWVENEKRITYSYSIDIAVNISNIIIRQIRKGSHLLFSRMPRQFEKSRGTVDFSYVIMTLNIDKYSDEVKQTNKTEKINSLWREHLEVKWECWVLNNLHILDLYKHQFLLPNLSIFIRHSIDRWFSYFNYQWM